MLDNNNDNLKSKTMSSLAWKMFEKSGAQIVQFVLSLVLARLLMPEDYGAIALLTIFIAIANVFIQGGFSNALIRKQDSDDLDYSSVFYTNLLISIVLYIVLFFTAPLIAEFYELPILKNVLRVMSLTIIIGTYTSMQNVILAKKMMFKRLFLSSFGAIIASGIVGVTIAYLGYGIWALVAQQVTYTVMTAIIMTFTVKWRPKLMFSFERLKSLFKFGWKLLLSSLLDVGYSNIYSLVIGKQYSPADLAYWNRGKQFPALIVDNINGSIGAVMYPVYATLQDDLPKLKSAVRRSIKTSAYLVFPLMAGLAVCAEPVVQLLLGDKWIFCVPFLQGWCFAYALMPIHTSNLQVYNALGRSDIFLILEIVKKVVGISFLFATLYFGLEWMMLGVMLSGISSGIINAAPNIKILKYSVKEQIFDLLPAAILSVFMGAVVFGVSYIPINYIGLLVIQVIVGMIIYTGLSWIFKIEAFNYLRSIIKDILSSIKGKLSKKSKNNNINQLETIIEKDNIDRSNDMQEVELLSEDEVNELSNADNEDAINETENEQVK